MESNVLKGSPMNSLTRFLASSYYGAIALLKHLENPLLLLIRVYFGYSISVTGRAHLMHIDTFTDFFTSLNLPAPHYTAIFVGVVELLGGIFLALGIGSRLTAFILFCDMTVAYITADKEAWSSFIVDQDKFTAAAPFTIWFASLLILILGPGKWAVDTLLARFWPDPKKS